MPVLKIKKNGVWEKLGGSTKLDGGNADTLDNKHASDFLTVERYDNEMGVLTEEVLPQKANAVHNHDDRYYTEQESDIMLQNKSDVNHTHTNVYAPVQHEHNYAPQNHSHSYNNLTDTPDMSSFASSNHNHDDTYASLYHNHSGTYAPLSHNHSSYVNQNAFSNVKVGSTTISADTTTDTLTLVAGNNITLTPNATSDQITISATSSSSGSYTHPDSGVIAGTYKSVTVNSEGHVTGGTNPTTLSGYGITDAVTGDDFALYIQSAADEMSGKADISHTHSSYINQNAFSNVKVGSTTISADTTTDTLTLVGSNVTLTPTASSDTITIGITKSNVTSALGYTPPTTNTTYGVVSTTSSGLAPKTDGSTSKFLRGDGTWAAPPSSSYTHPSYTAITGSPDSNQSPAFGGTFNVSQPVSDSLGHITSLNSRTITIPNTVATTSKNGLMTTSMVSKLNGIAAGATKVTVDSSLSSTSTNAIQNKAVYAALSNLDYAPKYAYGPSDLTAGVSPLATGTLYFVYE
jgi:hypothetical protein